MTAREFAAYIHNARQRPNSPWWDGACPAHDDQSQHSLSWCDGDRRLRLHCHAGCTDEQITAAVNLSPHDLRHTAPARVTAAVQSRIVTTYDYEDEGVVVFQALRYVPKAFKQRRVIPAAYWRDPATAEYAWSLAEGWYVRATPPRWEHVSGAQDHPPLPDALWLPPVPPLLYRLAEVAALRPPCVWVVEGEKDVDALWGLGVPATTNAGGAGKWKPEQARRLAAAGIPRVVVLPDNDAAGQAHAALVARCNTAEGITTHILELPGLPASGDVSDWLATGGDAAQLRALSAQAPVWAPATPEAGITLPSINLSDGSLPEQAQATWRAVSAANAREPRLFRRLDHLVRVAGSDDNEPLIQEVDWRMSGRLRWFLHRWVEWTTARGRGGPQRPIQPPDALIRDLMADPDWPVPVLRDVTAVPIFAADGRLIEAPGFDAREGVYLWPESGLAIPPIPAAPTAAQVAEAVAVLQAVIQDFPFCNAASRTHALALGLLPFCQRLIHGATPLHLVTKPTPGTGASLLVRAVLTPAFGDGLTPVTEVQESDEWRKRLTAFAARGERVLFIDNLNTKLAASAIMSAVTECRVKDRLLGETDLVTAKLSMTWVATGNNPRISAEGIRRVAGIQLDARLEKPWLRTGFTHPDLLAWVQHQRPALVVAALTLIRAWVVAGSPAWTGERLGGFERWTMVMGGILELAGLPDFLANREAVEALVDDEDAALRGFVALWWAAHASRSVTATLLLPIVDHDECDLAVEARTEQGRKVSLAHTLNKAKGRPWSLPGGGPTLVIERDAHARSRWKLVEQGTAEPGPATQGVIPF
jgi:hypothetical protein